MTSYLIRKAVPNDIQQSRRMQADSWLATYPNDEHGVSYEWVKERTDGWLTPESMQKSEEYFKKVLNDPRSFYRLAEKDGRVVGFIHIMDNDDGTRELEAIYTDPKTFGTGLGSQLMKIAKERIDERDTLLTVAIYNERAIQFYRKHGFEKIEGSEDLYADIMPVIRMIRKGDTE